MGPLLSRLAFALAALVLALAFGGERSPRDPRYSTPDRTVRTFWNCLASGAPEQALECFMGVGASPRGAQLLRLPALEQLELRDLRILPLGTGRALVQYQVHYRLRTPQREGSFETGDELLRVRGQWRILKPVSPRLEEPGPQPTRRKHPWSGPAYAGIEGENHPRSS